MEVKTPPKQLLKHTLPVLMIIIMLFAVSTVMLGGQGALDLNQAQNSALARGLVTRVFRVRPTANGLAKITLNNSAAPDPVAGSGLTDGLSQTGRVARLSFEVQ
jgi:hypothetical protein